MATILDGKALAAHLRTQIKEDTVALPRRPGLAVILVGEDPASQLYVRNKTKDCEECGYLSRRFDLPADTSEEILLGIINKLNRDNKIDGILVQLPLPPQINEKSIIEAIAPEKDVDAFHPVNVGRMVRGDALVWPCTPSGIQEMLDAYSISEDGKICVIVGRSNIVGKPMGLLLLRGHGTVIYCHRHTPDLAAMTRQADILVVAAGCRGLIRGDMVKEGAVVIDVAMNRDPETGKDALSKYDEKNLLSLSHDMHIDYIHMEDVSNVEYLLDSIKSGSVMKLANSDNVSYEDTYYYYVPLLLIFLAIEMILVIRRGRI